LANFFEKKNGGGKKKKKKKKKNPNHQALRVNFFLVGVFCTFSFVPFGFMFSSRLLAA